MTTTLVWYVLLHIRKKIITRLPTVQPTHTKE